MSRIERQGNVELLARPRSLPKQDCIRYCFDSPPTCASSGGGAVAEHSNGSATKAAPRAHTELAYDSIKDGITSGVLAPGEWLREYTVASSLGLSRTPVREALRVLAAEGVRADTTAAPGSSAGRPRTSTRCTGYVRYSRAMAPRSPPAMPPPTSSPSCAGSRTATSRRCSPARTARSRRPSATTRSTPRSSPHPAAAGSPPWWRWSPVRRLCTRAAALHRRRPATQVVNIATSSPRSRIRMSRWRRPR